LTVGHVSSSEAVLTSLKHFHLHEYDWDGVGGLPLRGDVADTVADIYDLAFADDMPMPVVSLNGDGTVEVAYEEIVASDLGKKLLLTFRCEGVVTFVKVFPDGDATVEGTIRLDGFARTDGKFNPDDFAELTELFAWIGFEE